MSERFSSSSIAVSTAAAEFFGDVARLLPAAEHETAITLLHSYEIEFVALAKDDYKEILIGVRGPDGTYK